jgi:hypothetical protein
VEINATDTLLAIILALQVYSIILGTKSKTSIGKISRGNTVKLNNICKVVSKNDFGEWDRLGKYVRIGSVEYQKALATPGYALLHRTGLVEEGNQDDSSSISD